MYKCTVAFWGVATYASTGIWGSKWVLSYAVCRSLYPIPHNQSGASVVWAHAMVCKCCRRRSDSKACGCFSNLYLHKGLFCQRTKTRQRFCVLTVVQRLGTCHHDRVKVKPWSMYFFSFEGGLKRQIHYRHMYSTISAPQPKDSL